VDILSAITTAGDKDKVYIGMIKQEAYELTTSESCPFDNTGFNHSDMGILSYDN
jgi:hypothetical protein